MSRGEYATELEHARRLGIHHIFLGNFCCDVGGLSEIHFDRRNLREYVLVAQDEPLIEVRSRDDVGNWISRVYRVGQQAMVGAIGATLDVGAIYREAKKSAPR